MLKRDNNLFREIDSAIETVAQSHPFPDYVRFSRINLLNTARMTLKWIPRPARAVDIGCGHMAKTAVLHVLGYRMTGIDDFGDDWHSSNTQSLRRFAQTMGIELVIGDASNPQTFDSLKSSSLDAVFITDVIEHIHGSPRVLLNHAGMLLRDEGYLVVGYPNSVNLRKRIDVLIGRTNYTKLDIFFNETDPYRGHVREFTPTETLQLFQLAGFQPLEVRTIHGTAMLLRLPHSWVRFTYQGICAVLPNLREEILGIAQKPPSWQPVPARPTTRSSPLQPGAAKYL